MKRNSNLLRWTLPSLAALAMVVAFAAVQSRADAPATAPAGAKITGTVTGANGLVSGAIVKLYKASDVPQHGGKNANKNAGGNAGGGKNMPPAVSQTTTDAQGAFAFDKIADGDYVVMANAKGEGHGRANVSVVNGANPAALAITLKQGGGKGNAPAPAPAAQ